MFRRLTLILGTLAAAAPAWAAEPLLPQPDSLAPAVRFWTRVYSEVDRQGGLIHDSEHMGVVYEVLRFPDGLSRRARERMQERTKDRYRKILRTLAAGKRTGLGDEEARVLALWPEGVADKTLERAASHLRFQLGQADKFRAGIVRSGRWRSYILGVLAQYGVPRELVALPHVESSYDPGAYSRVGAAGIWQFTRSTARLFLRVDHIVDERMDPWRATDGAARLLASNYRRLKSWPLAITAYNHGAGGMARALRVVGTDDIGEIVKRYKGRTFGFASRNFYAEFLAAYAIDQDPERYFGPITRDQPVLYRTFTPDAYYTASALESALGVDRQVLRDHNLALRPPVWNGAKLVPKGFELRLPARLVETEPATLIAAIPASERHARQHRDRFHKVRRGETLSGIASRYEVRMSELAALNNLRSRHRIRVGQVLRLPTDGRAAVDVARREPPEDGWYKVRRGDSLWIIASRYGVTQSQLAQWNSLRNRNRIHPGQRLRVTPPEVVVASAEPTRVVPAAPQTPKVPKAEPAPKPAPAPIVAVEDEPTPAPVAALEEAAETPPAAATAEVTGKAELPPARAIQAAFDGGERTFRGDPSAYEVSQSGRITVLPEETLGHYAEWLEVRASDLRRLNRMRYGAPLVIGRKKKLDFRRVAEEEFERRRLEYHRSLQEDFFEHFEVTGTRTHTLRRGESLWELAYERYEVPIWLLYEYNPDLDLGSLPAGAKMVVPVVGPRTRT